MTTFIKNITAAVDALGCNHPGIIMGIAQTAWESDEQRDQFLALVTGGQQ